jgi:hypothetical protein
MSFGGESDSKDAPQGADMARSRWNTIVPDVASALLLLGCAVFVFATYDDYAIAWDEPVHLDYGDYILNRLGLGGRDGIGLRFKRDYMYGGGFDALGAIARAYSNLDPYDTVHLLGGVIGLLGFVGSWRLGRFLGGVWGGLWSLAFIVFTPVYWGHMFFNPKDAPFAAGYIWGVYGVIRVAAVMPAVSPGLWFKLGLALAAALSVRIAGLLVVCYLGLAVVAYGVFRWAVTGRPLEAGRAWWAMGWRAGVSVAIGWVGMLLFWPWAQPQPVSGPFRALRGMTHFNLHARMYPFGGEWIRTFDAPWDYLPRMFAFKLPELVVVALCMGAVIGVFLLLRRRHEPEHAMQTFAYVILAISIAFPPLYAILRSSPLYDGVRHFLFLVPPICVAAGLTMAWIQAETRRRSTFASAVIVLALLLFCGRQARVMEHMHPIEYAWFNAFAGGLPGVEDRYDIDYYGGSYEEAIDALETYLWETEPDEFATSTYTVRGCLPTRIMRRYMPPNFRYTSSGRFHAGYTRDNCHKEYPDAPEVARVERFGVPFNIIRDLEHPSFGEADHAD